MTRFLILIGATLDGAAPDGAALVSAILSGEAWRFMIHSLTHFGDPQWGSTILSGGRAGECVRALISASDLVSATLGDGDVPVLAGAGLGAGVVTLPVSTTAFTPTLTTDLGIAHRVW